MMDNLLECLFAYYLSALDKAIILIIGVKVKKYFFKAHLARLQVYQITCQ
jgi:hypothetical protein